MEALTTIWPSAATATMVAGDEGNDAIDGGSGDDRLSGGSGNDTLLGQAGKDHLVGDEGADVLVGGGDEDIVMGGAGNDTIAGEGDPYRTNMTGGDGLDTLDYSSVSQSITIDLSEGKASGEEIGDDTISNFGGGPDRSGDDSVTASLEAEIIATGAGDDTVKDAGGIFSPIFTMAEMAPTRSIIPACHGRSRSTSAKAKPRAQKSARTPSRISRWS